MPYAIGIALAILTALLVTTAGFDRDRAVYPTLLIMIASYYVLFAVMGGSVHALSIESVVMLGFALVVVRGFAVNLWWVVGAMEGHGVFDFVRSRLIENRGVTARWSAFCLAFEVCLSLRGRCMARPRAGLLPSVQRREGR